MDKAATTTTELLSAIREMGEALNGILAVAEMTTFSDQYPAECERARAAIEKYQRLMGGEG